MDISNNSHVLTLRNLEINNSNDDSTDESYASFGENIDVTTTSKNRNNKFMENSSDQASKSETCLSTSSKKFLIDNILGLENCDESGVSEKSDNERTKKDSVKLDNKFFKPTPVSANTHTGN